MPPRVRQEAEWIAAAALAWGFAEATLFFIVPDVLLSWIALDRPRRAWAACAWAAAGAVAGGLAMYLWGAAAPASALGVLDHVPAISPAMCDAVGEQVRDRGVGAVFLGPILGTPYKIYAVQAGAAHLGLGPFLLASLPARLVRFLLVTGLTAGICQWLKRRDPRGRRIAHAAIWTAFYAAYFAAVGW